MASVEVDFRRFAPVDAALSADVAPDEAVARFGALVEAAGFAAAFFLDAFAALVATLFDFDTLVDLLAAAGFLVDARFLLAALFLSTALDAVAEPLLADAATFFATAVLFFATTPVGFFVARFFAATFLLAATPPALVFAFAPAAVPLVFFADTFAMRHSKWYGKLQRALLPEKRSHRNPGERQSVRSFVTRGKRSSVPGGVSG